ncbi:acyl-coenzyme A diphosphatase FITM2 [Phymastichus coffea]|uniref:acyl-coenzyme A diphosphatase FITM2 n=1 Tax=Phymastichus coffea TaxID=108790 RepID=UPI00273AE16C|nr:acyl-coenzyme A diphosphatase FITM2 [Phymastichus coffea]
MSKRKPINVVAGSSPKNTSVGSSYYKNANLNFRPSSMQENRGGTRPVAEPSSISSVIVSMILHICRKSLLYDPRLKAVIYFGAVFFGSIVCDVMPIPKTYFARSSNIFNQFFIKWAWGWLLATAGPWILLTAYTIGCGKKEIILKHLARLGLATLFWMSWISFMNYIESNYGRCVNVRERSLQNKVKCLAAGHFWNGLDVSGHAFIIIYSSLILSEEGYSLVGWEAIKNNIMNEEYNRKTSTQVTKGYLNKISDEDLDFLKKTYKDLTPYLRGLFIIMTIQQIIWDVMLVATILYYHTMIEKFFGAAAAILTWYATYYWLYRFPNLGFCMPSEGIFKYNELRENTKENGVRSSYRRY